MITVGPELAKAIFDVLDAKKAHKLKVLRVNDQTVITDYFVICTGNSSTQVKAVESAFTCHIIDRIKADIRELATADTVDTLVEVARIRSKYKEVSE